MLVQIKCYIEALHMQINIYITLGLYINLCTGEWKI